MAFGLGFYIMLHTDTDPNKMGAIDPASDYYFFDSPWLALVKTATMFVGEIEFAGTEQDYRVTMVVAYLGWVDYDFGHSSVCLVLLGQMGIWQNRLVNRARWCGTSTIRVNPVLACT